jgi:hypothetical protein
MVDENISNIILERVNRIGERLKSLDEIRSDVAVLKESVRRIDARIAYMDSYLAGVHSQLDGKRRDGRVKRPR